MRPVEFSSEEIVSAGEELLASGRNVTGFALRQRVGGGNPGRLRQVWDEHIASKSVAKAEPVAELPVEVAEEVATVSKTLVERIAALASELNDKAVKAAERRVSEVVRSAGEQREQVERELRDAAQTVEDLETQFDQVRSELAACEERLAAMSAKSQQQEIELGRLGERLASSEQSAKMAQVQHVAVLERERAQHASELEKAKAQHAAEFEKIQAQIVDERGRHEKEVETLRAASRKLEIGLASLQEKAAGAEQSHQNFRTEAAHEAQLCADRVVAAEKRCDVLSKEAADARESAARLAGQLEALQTQNAKLIEAIGKGKGSA